MMGLLVAPAILRAPLADTRMARRDLPIVLSLLLAYLGGMIMFSPSRDLFRSSYPDTRPIPSMEILHIRQVAKPASC